MSSGSSFLVNCIVFSVKSSDEKLTKPFQGNFEFGRIWIIMEQKIVAGTFPSQVWENIKKELIRKQNLKRPPKPVCHNNSTDVALAMFTLLPTLCFLFRLRILLLINATFSAVVLFCSITSRVNPIDFFPTLFVRNHFVGSLATTIPSVALSQCKISASFKR